MGKCFNEQLPVSAINENLVTYGTILVTIKHLDNIGVEQPRFVQHIADGVTVKTKDGLAHLSLNSDMSNPQNEITIRNSYTPIYFENAGYDYKVEISNKYSQKTIHWQLIGLPVSTDVKNIMYLNNNDGDVALNLFYSGCIGDITPLADNVYQKTFIAYESGVTINIDEFVGRRIAKGVATYSATDISINLSHIYFGNKSNFEALGYLIWESAQKIAIVKSTGSVKYVYERGYNAEEIAVWQIAGLTVTDVISGTVYPPTNS